MSGRYEFFNHSDGSRVRVPHGKIGPVSLVRERYSMHVENIRDTHDLRASLRAGSYTSLGGYPVFFITSDCAALCFDCVRREYRQVSESVRKRLRDGWRVKACAVNWEDSQLLCDHCGEVISSAYGED